MSTNLSKYIKQERLRQGLNTAQLSEMMGYKNINKGMRRIIDLEREGRFHPEILKKITVTLGLDEDIVDELIQQDKEEQQREFEQWVNTPISWHLIIRWMPAVYGEKDIPGYIKTEEEAIEYTKWIARKNKFMVWLVLTRRENVHIGADGEIISRNEVTQDYLNLPNTTIK